MLLRVARRWRWWQRSGILAWAAAGMALLLAAGAVVAAHHAGAYRVLAMPLGIFIAIVVAPAFLAALVFAHAVRQEALDRQAGPGRSG
ncbi:MAG: hypothetical protein BroJett030_16390 [Alphaproteobacteria bacterium]|nr:MAG: hypothetical protein BroJett030_16390 [Alphaproteobacteria bacterium]